MPYIACPHCDRELGRPAAICPHCRRDIGAALVSKDLCVCSHEETLHAAGKCLACGCIGFSLGKAGDVVRRSQDKTFAEQFEDALKGPHPERHPTIPTCQDKDCVECRERYGTGTGPAIRQALLSHVSRQSPAVRWRIKAKSSLPYGTVVTEKLDDEEPLYRARLTDMPSDVSSNEHEARRRLADRLEHIAKLLR